MSGLLGLRAPRAPLLATPASERRETGDLAVVHLVWGPLGPEPLQRFLRAYREHPAGVEHELVVLFNGVAATERARLLEELAGVAHRLIVLARPVQDLVAYIHAAEQIEHGRLCFLNSHSEPLVPGWLAKLDGALADAGVGLVGATGSWASTRSWVLHALGLPTPYRGVMPPRSVARAQFLEIELEREGRSVADQDEPPRRSTLESLLAKLRTLPAMPTQMLGFEGFPAHHLRTNAFIVRRTTLRHLRTHPITSKMDAYQLENGRHSLTRQVQAMGLHTLVVARDGSAYPHERWPQARTFWQGDQEGLLVADNQTRSYAVGGADRRRLLAAFAWGPFGEPAWPPGGSANTAQSGDLAAGRAGVR